MLIDALSGAHYGMASPNSDQLTLFFSTLPDSSIRIEDIIGKPLIPILMTDDQKQGAY